MRKGVLLIIIHREGNGQAGALQVDQADAAPALLWVFDEFLGASGSLELVPELVDVAISSDFCFVQQNLDGNQKRWVGGNKTQVRSRG